MRGGLLAGRYRLDSLLGRGGMGEVWRASDLRLNRTVAIKVLPARGASERAVARFRREAEIAAGLQHPGIATVFDIDTDVDTDSGDGTLFLVMELLDGTDLAAVAARHPGGLPVGRAVPILAQIADALAGAHAKGVVHRDVKPANVMLLDGDRTKILDFGIARYAEQTTDLTGSAMIGTPAFMAPEQFDRATPVDHRTDLYALGGVAYQLLTGRRPFTADTVPELLHAVLLTPAPAVRDTRPDVPEELGRLVAELLAKKPDDRPDDAGTVAARLRAVTAAPGERPARTLETTAPPPPPAVPVTRTVPPPQTVPPTPVVAPDPRRRGLEIVPRVALGTLLGCVVAAVLVYFSFVVAAINPGGALVDQGDFAKSLPCTDIRPAAFSTPESEAGTRDGGSCGWTISKKRPFRSLAVFQSIVETSGWTSAVEEARNRMANPVLGSKEVERQEPTLGPDAYSISSPDRPDACQMAFRKSNLVVSVRYTEDHGVDGDPDPGEVCETALELAGEISTRVK
ncbi:serine/threonine-protein kinase [Actinomadura welshii]